MASFITTIYICKPITTHVTYKHSTIKTIVPKQCKLAQITCNTDSNICQTIQFPPSILNDPQHEPENDTNNVKNLKVPF